MKSQLYNDENCILSAKFNRYNFSEIINLYRKKELKEKKIWKILNIRCSLKALPIELCAADKISSTFDESGNKTSRLSLISTDNCFLFPMILTHRIYNSISSCSILCNSGKWKQYHFLKINVLSVKNIYIFFFNYKIFKINAFLIIIIEFQ